MEHGELVEGLFREGQSTWPAWGVTLDAFRAHCEHALRKRDGDPRPHAADLYLCCACACGVKEAMTVVERRGAEGVTRAIGRICSDAEFVGDTVQEFWDRLFRYRDARIASYSGCGPLEAWLRVVATRLALDRVRAGRRLAGAHVELGDYLVAECRDPECEVLGRRYVKTVEASVRLAVAELSPRERNLLRMHLFGSVGIDDIGRIFGVHRATAARWLQRTRRTLRESTRRHFARECPGLSSSEFLSIGRALEGVVDVTIPSVVVDPSSTAIATGRTS